jgi:hypothetical protein
MYRMVFALLCASVLSAGIITTTSSGCQAGATFVNNSVGTCSASDPSGAHSSTTASGSLSDLVLGPVLDFNAQFQLLANDFQVYGTGIDIPQFPASASVTFDMVESIMTPGSVRPGFLTFDSATGSVQNTMGLAESTFNSTVTVGSYSNTWSQSVLEWTLIFFPGAYYQTTNVPRFTPITLGTPLTVDIFGQANAGGGPFGDISNSSHGQINLTFSLFEADQTTKVLIEATPEVSSFALACLGLAGLLLARTKCSNVAH